MRKCIFMALVLGLTAAPPVASAAELTTRDIIEALNRATPRGSG